MSRRALPFRLNVAGATHIGGRRANDDHYAFDDALGLLAVADGVSSRPAGRIAAETAIATLFAYLADPSVPLLPDARERVEDAVAYVHRRVREQSATDSDLRGMATTLAFAVAHGDLLAVGHVGDSRVLRLRDGCLERLTSDHRIQHDLLVRSRLTSEALRSYGPTTLTRAIGLGDTVRPDVRIEELRRDDGFLVTTDGLTGVVDDETIGATLMRHREPQEAVDALVRLAVAENAADNIAVVYGRWQALGG